MAQKRMFDKTITNSDDFIEMPDSSQNLYFHLSMNADDDGFVNNWKSIMRMTGHKEDDLKVLILKNYIIPFDSGVIVIKHWRINNYLRNDRYVETKFKTEKEQLTIDENLVYQLDTNGIRSIDKNSIEKISIDKNNISAKQMLSQRFTPPTLEEVKQYCLERNNNVNPERFIDFYESKGWMIGKSKMKDWKACVRTWEKDTPKKEEKRENMPNWIDEPIKVNNKEDEEEFDDILSAFK